MPAQVRAARPAPRKQAPGPSPQAAAAPPGKGRSRRGCIRPPKIRTVLFLTPLLLLGALVLGGFWAYRTFSGIDRVDLAGVLDPVAGPNQNYLLVGSDSRDGLDPDGGVGGVSTVTGKRSDTIIVLRVTPGGTAMMSIPRDLVVVNAATGRKGRINGAYNDGPANLVRTVQQNLRIPVNHYMEVGFATFAGVVDAVGGITVNVPYPAYDTRSGLKIDQAGDVVLDGRQALAYVRSRHYTEVVDGKPRTDPTADLGRQQRQQQFLRTALGEVGRERNPVALVRAASAVSGGLTIDNQMGFFGALGLVRTMAGGNPLTVVLPTKPSRLGGAQVLVLAQPQAEQTLAGFR